MPTNALVTDPIQATCSFCGYDARYEVLRGDFDLSSVARNKTTFPPAVRRTLKCARCDKGFHTVILGPRRLIGFHGCSLDFARKITDPEVDIEEWNRSDKAWDWLGDGVYFWEQAPLRAWEWAVAMSGRTGTSPAVVGAPIAPRTLVDLGDTEFADRLVTAYEIVKSAFAERGKPIPENRPFRANLDDPDRKFRALDRLVIEELVGGPSRNGVIIEAVRAPFQEGEEAYPGAAIYLRSHVQIAVRDLSCIRYTWLARQA